MPRAHALSYVIPARNAGVTLSKTLESLRAQRAPLWRAVVIDDGSTDNTARIAQASNDPRITTIRTPPQGVARAREAGVEALPDDQSPVCFLDADDWVEPGHSALLLDSIAGHDAAACGYAMVDEDGADLDFRRTPDITDHQLDRQLQCNRFLIGCVALSRGIIEQVRLQFGSLFDPSLRCEDWDFWLRITRAGARWADPINLPLLNYRQGESTRSSARQEMYRDSLVVVRTHAPDSKTATRAMRQAGLRMLAGAVAHGDETLAQAALADLESIAPEEHNDLASALRWALFVHERSRFTQGDLSIEEIASRIERTLGSAVNSQSLAQRAALTDSAWRRIARRALEALHPNQTLVVYGLGHNGRYVLRELLAIAPERVAWMDDGEPTGQPGTLRMSLQGLDDRHVVLITPDDREPLVNRLKSCHPAHVLLPEQLQCIAPAVVSA